ncbi:polysaccharide pyruvyl transferase family protein [Halopseudomonas maritima]|uniref:polysaccharide pyruvyl transferase family protein n=1 Tax=Halopseudomonas maritima TaxID=2918528 RepID=UPI001EEBA48D|nr:polysaccharide pyruvyl transferase family protein [Halopseudomonas maritima]UJJ32051.1 polysaccharide pyruvyl transferase family protein [Halopseudomonas maritima]
MENPNKGTYTPKPKNAMKNNIVYTITFHSVLNHGAVLQAYALQEYLRKLNYQPVIANYTPPYFMAQVLRPAKGIGKTALKYKRLYLFKKFSEQHLVKSTRYISRKKLTQLPIAHAAICGSDQIWNKLLTNGAPDKAYYLSFIKEGTKKIAYGASAGGHTLESSEHGALDLLKDFDAIGVRENHLCENLKNQHTLKNVQMVSDPSLLISDYNNIMDHSKTPKSKYIVSYEVSSDATRAEYSKYLKKAQELTKLPVYHIGDKFLEAADHNILAISPSQWLSLISSSEYVVTNSFHGAMFSMNFKKKFSFIKHLEEEKNARTMSLLKKVRLEEKAATTTDQLSEIFKDYHTGELQKFIKESQNFLISALENNEK